MFKVSNSSLRIFLGAFLGATCGLMLPTANANIIDSTYGAGAGSFELGAFVDNSGGNGYMSLAPSDTTITGWTVGGPGVGVDWLTKPNWGADTGVKSVDLQYLFTDGSIATIIPTVANAVYELSFGAAAVSGYTNTGVVSAGSLVNQVFTAPFSGAFASQVFSPFAFQFTATGPTTTIRFTATGPSTTYGPVIDSVSVDPVSSVPEPSSIALLLLGGGVLCARVRTSRHCGMRNA